MRQNPSTGKQCWARSDSLASNQHGTASRTPAGETGQIPRLSPEGQVRPTRPMFCPIRRPAYPPSASSKRGLNDQHPGRWRSPTILSTDLLSHWFISTPCPGAGVPSPPLFPPGAVLFPFLFPPPTPKLPRILLSTTPRTLALDDNSRFQEPACWRCESADHDTDSPA